MQYRISDPSKDEMLTFLAAVPFADEFDEFDREEGTGRPFMVTHPNNGKTRRHLVPDRETGALKRLDKIMARYPGLGHYVQGDPRGAALYILPPGTIPAGADVDAYYSRGIAVYR